MTNRNKKSHFAKSKILLITLCILGLAFSYSCSCRNPSSGQGENGGDVSGSFLMQIDSDGRGYKQTATVSFDKSTAKLKGVEDVDSGLSDADFVYEGNTLKLKAGDNGNIDADTKNKITWDGNETKKVKATFTLTPKAENIDLDSNEKTVEISIKKVKKIDVNNFESFLQQNDKIAVGQAPGNLCEFITKTGTYSTGTFTIENSATDNFAILSKSTCADAAVYCYGTLMKDKGFKSAELVVGSEAGGGESDIFYSVKIKFTYDSDNYEVSEPETITFKFINKKTSVKWSS